MGYYPVPDIEYNNNPFIVIYTKINTPYKITHFHNSVEILYSESDGVVFIDNEKDNFKKGDVIFINSGQLHSIVADKDFYNYGILFNWNILITENKLFFESTIIKKLEQRELMLPKFCDIPMDIQNKLKRIVLNIINIYFCKNPHTSDKSIVSLSKGCASPFWEYKIISLLYDMLYILAINALLAIPLQKNNENEIKIIKKTIAYMEKNFATNITIKELADNAFISKSHLFNVFKKNIGISPIAFLRNIRIDNSKMLLMDGYSVTEAALRSGFNNIGYYTEIFKKLNDISPKKFQKIHLYVKGT